MESMMESVMESVELHIIQLCKCIADHELILLLVGHTDCETHSNIAGEYPGGLFYRPIIGQQSFNYMVICVVYYSLQGNTGLIIHSTFAQQYTEFDTLPPSYYNTLQS